jgi:hypothetical protein
LGNSEEESCSDHNIIKFGFGQDIYHDTVYHYNRHRYVVADENLKKFNINLSGIVATIFSKGLEDSVYLDRDLASQVKKLDDIESAVDLFQEALILTYKKFFKIRRATKKTTKHKSVPWWTVELILMRKRINALRRRYQRTTNNEDLRESRINQYHEKKQNIKQQQKKGKIESWKEFCNLTSSTNPWNAVYKLVLNKVKTSETLSTLQKPDGSLTTDINKIITYILDYLNTKVEVDKDSDYHKTIRTLTEQPIHTTDDREFTPDEIGNAIYAINCKKAPGEDGITGDIFQPAYKQFPKLINILYECLRQGCFPKR